jgi:hypothetical protein
MMARLGLEVFSKENMGSEVVAAIWSSTGML